MIQDFAADIYILLKVFLFNFAIMMNMILQEFSTGLEGSALGGEGFGIEKFKPQRGPLQISTNLKIPNVAKVLLRDGEYSEGYVLQEASESETAVIQHWNHKVIDQANINGEWMKFHTSQDNSLYPRT